MNHTRYKNILFCTDFSENADHAFDVAYDIARRDEGILYILYVIPDNPHRKFAELYIPNATMERIHKEFEDNLVTSYKEHYIRRISNGIPFKVVTRSGRQDAEIIKFAMQQKADLIVMGTHGRKGMKHAIIGSVAEKVLRHSPIPVFVIPSMERPESLH